MRVFLSDGYMPIDNNAAELGIRTLFWGKKNWYTIDTVSGAQSSAVIYSIAETARENNLMLYEYFKYLLEEIPKHGEFEDPHYLDDLLPWSENLPDCCRKPEAKPMNDKVVLNRGLSRPLFYSRVPAMKYLQRENDIMENRFDVSNEDSHEYI